MRTFSRRGEVSTNAFVNNVQYFLRTIRDADIKKVAVCSIYFEEIVKVGKDVIVNTQSEEWVQIKYNLKLEYNQT